MSAEGASSSRGRLVLRLTCTRSSVALRSVGEGDDALVLGRLEIPNATSEQSKFISRNHALVSHDGVHCVLADQGSPNGTYLNGIRLKKHAPEVLRAGDVIRVGGLPASVVGEKQTKFPKWSWRLLVYMALSCVVSVAISYSGWRCI